MAAVIDASMLDFASASGLFSFDACMAAVMDASMLEFGSLSGLYNLSMHGCRA